MPLNHIYLEWIRSFSLFAHILLTTVLYWTKFDSILVTLSPQSSDLAYSKADETLTGLLSVSIIFLLLEVVFRAAEIHVTLWTLIHVFLDSCGCFFITWIVLDGLAWETYIYVFFFCSGGPLTYAVMTFEQRWERHPAEKIRQQCFTDALRVILCFWTSAERRSCHRILDCSRSRTDIVSSPKTIPHLP